MSKCVFQRMERFSTGHVLAGCWKLRYSDLGSLKRSRFRPLPQQGKLERLRRLLRGSLGSESNHNKVEERIPHNADGSFRAAARCLQV